MKKLIAAIMTAFLSGCSERKPKAMPEKETGPKIEIDLQWGGYYASKEDGQSEYGVFRLLDFNRDAYHVAILQEKFSEIPSMEEVLRLSPYIGHAPIDSRALLRKQEIHLLGGPVLTEDDLEGYRFYLEHHDVSKDEIHNLFKDIIGFGRKPPMKLTLFLEDGELGISER
jgi:hypothetical protein